METLTGILSQPVIREAARSVPERIAQPSRICLPLRSHRLTFAVQFRAAPDPLGFGCRLRCLQAGRLCV